MDYTKSDLLDQHGPLMSGRELWVTLGFKTSDSFRKAKSEGRLGVSVFSIPERRGTYAYTRDVAKWLTELSKEDNM